MRPTSDWLCHVINQSIEAMLEIVSHFANYSVTYIELQPSSLHVFLHEARPAQSCAYHSIFFAAISMSMGTLSLAVKIGHWMTRELTSLPVQQLTYKHRILHFTDLQRSILEPSTLKNLDAAVKPDTKTQN